MKILIVEDEESIRGLIQMTLQMENYDTVEADNGREAYERIQEENFDLILLDIMLPGMDGYQLLQKIKGKGIPVIFLTARIAVQDRVFGLKMGADDYITKPFEPIELLARIEAVLRRTAGRPEAVQRTEERTCLLYGDIQIIEQERSVKKSGEEIPLTVKEFDLLLLFVKNPNIVFSREQLLDQVWGYDYYGGTRTVDMHIKQLRQKLGLKEDLETVFRVGYKLKK